MVEYREGRDQVAIRIEPEGELDAGDTLVFTDAAGNETARLKVDTILLPDNPKGTTHVAAGDQPRMVLVTSETAVEAEATVLVRKPGFVLFNQVAAVVLVAGALVSIWRTAMLSKMTVVADERGLTIGRRDTIPWERVGGIDTSRFKKKGLAWVTWTDEGGGTHTWRVDDRVYSEAEALVKVIREQTGSPAEDDGSEPPKDEPPRDETPEAEPGSGDIERLE